MHGGARQAPALDRFTRVTASEHRGWSGYRWSMVGHGRAQARTRRPVAARAGSAALVALLAAALTGCSGGPASSGDQDVPTPPTTADAGRPEVAARSTPAEQPSPTPGPAQGDAGTPRVGSLVEDFPVELLPVPRDAVLLVTSAVPVGTSAVREVSLNLRTRLSVAEIMRMYRDGLTEAGFSEVTPPTDELGPTADATFTRSGGDELVTIGVVDVDGARTLTLGGRVRTGADP